MAITHCTARRLNSSVRPQRALLFWWRCSSRYAFGLCQCRASFVYAARPACSWRANSRAQPVVAGPARVGTRHARHARVAGVLRARLLQPVGCLGAAHSRHRRPSASRAVAAFSSQRYCLAKVVHLVRPNYSFKATVMCRGDNPLHRAAP